MGFATDWLNRRALFPKLITDPPDNHTGIIVVVPSFDEPLIHNLLDSLNSCTVPECAAEIIIVVNAPGSASPEQLRNNSDSIKKIDSWKKRNKSFFRTHVIDTGQNHLKEWGVGLARKTGMDEAVRRFDSINMPEGVISSLDADCRVSKNYFTSLYEELLLKKERKACSVYFEHPVSGNEFPEHIYRNIIQYELHLRYFIHCLIYAGYPGAFHTVGSAFALKALQYIRSGGMNRKQAGEDFYFVQKLIPLGGYFELKSTTVYPSPRESGRVPFGTGAMMATLSGDLSGSLFTYNLQAFTELKEFFASAESLFNTGEKKIIDSYYALPESVKSFIDIGEWSARMIEIRNNTSSYGSFRKRFFTWFNTFRIVKYLNHVHEGIFIKQDVSVAAAELMRIINPRKLAEGASELLTEYRKMDREN